MKTVKGDLLKLAKDGQFDIIVHGCNCYHTMGAGIAYQIATQYPSAMNADMTDTVYADPNKLGTYSSVEVSDGFIIINGYTQFGMGGGTRQVKYDAVDLLFKKIAKDFPNSCRIGVPLIGAGLAGGDWEIIKVIIERALEGFDVTIVEYDG